MCVECGMKGAGGYLDLLSRQDDGVFFSGATAPLLDSSPQESPLGKFQIYPLSEFGITFSAPRARVGILSRVHQEHRRKERQRRRGR